MVTGVSVVTPSAAMPTGSSTIGTPESSLNRSMTSASGRSLNFTSTLLLSDFWISSFRFAHALTLLLELCGTTAREISPLFGFTELVGRSIVERCGRSVDGRQRVVEALLLLVVDRHLFLHSANEAALPHQALHHVRFRVEFARLLGDSFGFGVPLFVEQLVEFLHQAGQLVLDFLFALCIEFHAFHDFAIALGQFDLRLVRLDVLLQAFHIAVHERQQLFLGAGIDFGVVDTIPQPHEAFQGGLRIRRRSSAGLPPVRW